MLVVLEIQKSGEIKNTDNAQIKYKSEKENNTKNSKTKLAWFSRLSQHLARKRGGHIQKNLLGNPRCMGSL